MIRFFLWLAACCGWDRGAAALEKASADAATAGYASGRAVAVAALTEAENARRAAQAQAAASQAAEAAADRRYRDLVAQIADLTAQALQAGSERDKAVADLQTYTLKAFDVRPGVFHRAVQLTAETARITTSSGEAKRHRVYAQLLKEFPDAPRRDVGLAIELALRQPAPSR